MLNKRLVVMFVAVALLIVTAVIVTAVTPMLSSGAVARVNSSSQPSGNILGNQDLSDYALRHPDVRIAIALSGPDLSDYALRHPDARSVVPAANADLSDYFLRHPTSAIPAGNTASDWFERHPESLKAGNAVDLSDYYQRHAGVGPD